MDTRQKFLQKRKEQLKKKVMSDSAKRAMLKENLDPDFGIGGGAEEELEEEVLENKDADGGQNLLDEGEDLPLPLKKKDTTRAGPGPKKPVPVAVLTLKYNRFFLKNKVKPEQAAVLTLAAMVAELSVVVSRLPSRDVTGNPEEINVDDLGGLSIS